MMHQCHRNFFPICCQSQLTMCNFPGYLHLYFNGLKNKCMDCRDRSSGQVKIEHVKTGTTVQVETGSSAQGQRGNRDALHS